MKFCSLYGLVSMVYKFVFIHIVLCWQVSSTLVVCLSVHLSLVKEK